MLGLLFVWGKQLKLSVVSRSDYEMQLAYMEHAQAEEFKNCL